MHDNSTSMKKLIECLLILPSTLIFLVISTFGIFMWITQDFTLRMSFVIFLITFSYILVISGVGLLWYLILLGNSRLKERISLLWSSIILGGINILFLVACTAKSAFFFTSPFDDRFYVNIGYCLIFLLPLIVSCKHWFGLIKLLRSK